MKILLITGSPRKKGNSNTLAESFARGASEKGHDVVRFDTPFKNIHPCVACNNCKVSGQCVFNDDFNFIKENIASFDVVVFASPVYYFGLSAQLKAAIDRFYAIEDKMRKPMKTALLLTLADTSTASAKPSVENYRAIVDYLRWTNLKEIVATGVWDVLDVARTAFDKEAYDLGKSL